MTRAQALLLMAVAAVWATSLGAGFVFDDIADVVENAAAQAASFFERLPATLRPLLKASYALQDWLHGPWAPGFHAGNVALHVAATAVVFCLLRRLLRQSSLAHPSTRGADAPLLRTRSESLVDKPTDLILSSPARPGVSEDGPQARVTLAAFLAAALWAIHPALTASVTQVAGRSALLSGLLVLASLLLATGPPTRLCLLGAGLLAFLAPLARETALVLPLLLLWWQLTLGRRDRCWRRALPVWTGTLLAAALILLLPRHRELIDFSLETRAPLEALRGNLVAIPAMLRFLVMPWDLSVDPAQPRPWGWSDWPTLLSLVGLAATALVAWLLRRRRPLAAFALGWTLLCLLPSNSLLWRSDPVALRPLYLAALGPVVLLSLVLARRRAGLVLAGALVVLLAAMTVERNRLYADPVALWADAVEEAPEKARPWVQLGLALLDRERLSEAEVALCEGLRRQPGSLPARRGLERLQALAPQRPLALCAFLIQAALRVSGQGA
jgi:hypothetical protein